MSTISLTYEKVLVIALSQSPVNDISYERKIREYIGDENRELIETEISETEYYWLSQTTTHTSDRISRLGRGFILQNYCFNFISTFYGI